MVKDQKQNTGREPAKQGVQEVLPEPNKIGASTPYDFHGKSLTAYGGLLPVVTMLEKLGFQQVVGETLSVKRKTKVMTMYQFLLAMALAGYVGFSRLYHLRFVQLELREATLDTDTTVHTLFGNQMGARKGDRPSGQEIAKHLESAFAALPETVKTVRARAGPRGHPGFYCWEAVEAHERRNCRFILVARKTSRLVDVLKAADWRPSARWFLA
jgi:hypothetical protein